jgi:hypothetical protein
LCECEFVNWGIREGKVLVNECGFRVGSSWTW